MENVFEPGELDILVNDILTESLAPEFSSSSSNEEPQFTAEVSNVTDVIVQDPDLETIDIQDLIGGVSWEDLFIENEFSESPNPSVTSRRSRDSSISEDFHQSSGSSSCETAAFHCPVCGNPSGKHLYYGAQVCSSCRAFFRRSTINSAAEEFRCKADKKCGIDSKSWKSCKFCRFQKCLSAGMRPNWVMNDEERTQRNAKRKRTRTKRVDNVVSEAVLSHQWTVDEDLQIRGIREEIFEKTSCIIAKFYADNPMILNKFIACANNRTPFDSVLLAYTKRFVSNGMMKMFNELLVLQHINPMDRFLLLSRNYAMWSSFEEAILFKNRQEVIKNQQNVRNSLNKIKTSADGDQAFNVDMIQEAMDKISLEDNVESSDVIDNLIQDQQTRDRRRSLITSIQAWPKFNANGVSDDILTTLMMMILICCPDALQLNSESAVSQFQNQYCYILYRYINSKYPGQAHSKLGEGMEIVSKVREMTAMGEAALAQTMCNL
uniref:Nuclear receptor n=1 Tax=Tigriopus japonicus TaxID=158387 RepID=A0A0A7CKA3_TIGJA|nr:nuclear receptor [Tigriopus japonicus]